MSLKVNTFATLPHILVEDFEKIEFTKFERNHALKFLDNLMRRSYREFGMIDSFVETPKNYFRKAFNSQYLIWLNKLISSKIIISNNSYSNINNNIYSKSYKLNNKYTTIPIMWLIFDESPYKSVPYMLKIDKSNISEKKDFIMVSEDLKTLNIDRKILVETAAEDIEKVTISDFKTNDNIDRDSINVIMDDDKIWMSRKEALEKSKLLGKSLIQDDNKFYIIDEYEFLLKKKSAMLQAYQDSINKLCDKVFYGKRNGTNNRLDTNLTNMAKILTDKICKHNNLVQFDLCNAQFAILSDLLEDVLKTEDFLIFKEHSYNGTLYEYIMEVLDIKERKVAKKMMFELMFSKETFQSPLKLKLKKVFPSVVEIVDNYKKEKGYNQFSIMLQKRESEIFIDGLWTNIKNKNIFCTPKHDCLIIRERDEEKVIGIIEDYFNKIGFKGKIIKQ